MGKYEPNYLDMLLAGTVGYFIGKFGDEIIKFVKRLFTSFKRKILFKEINKRKFNSILSLDHAETGYDVSDIKIKLSPYSLYYAPPNRLMEQLNTLFHTGNFKIKDYGLSHFNFSKVPNFNSLLDKNKLAVSNRFIESASSIHPLFNGQKFGIFDLKIKRVPDSSRGELILELYKTDYFTHMVTRQIYRSLNAVKELSDQLNNDFFRINFNNYKFLNTSFGMYIMVQVDEGFVFCRRSNAVSNSEEAGRWHVSVDEGLDIQDLEQRRTNPATVSILDFAMRGLKEELGLTRGLLDKYVDGKINFLDVFLETKRYELILSAHVKLAMSISEFKSYYETAKDGRYETTDIICIENHFGDLEQFFKNYLVTDMAKYCVERIMSRK